MDLSVNAYSHVGAKQEVSILQSCQDASCGKGVSAMLHAVTLCMFVSHTWSHVLPDVPSCECCFSGIRGPKQYDLSLLPLVQAVSSRAVFKNVEDLSGSVAGINICKHDRAEA